MIRIKACEVEQKREEVTLLCRLAVLVDQELEVAQPLRIISESDIDSIDLDDDSVGNNRDMLVTKDAFPEARELLLGLIQVSEHLGTEGFRSDSASNLVWGLAKLSQVFKNDFKAYKITSSLLGIEGGRRVAEDVEVTLAAGVITGEQEVVNRRLSEHREQTGGYLVEGLITAFLAGHELCRDSGRSVLSSSFGIIHTFCGIFMIIQSAVDCIP